MGGTLVLLALCAAAAEGFKFTSSSPGTAGGKFALTPRCCSSRCAAARGGRRRTWLHLAMKDAPVRAPAGFTPPDPKPLTATGDWSGLLSASLALVLRLGAGITVTGWAPRISLQPPEAGEYALAIGPVYLSDTSAVIRSECPRPTGRLILYEFDSSPYCRKVRDACAMLDLAIDCRPCPGALPGGKFSDELYARMGRRTVPFLIDEGLGVELFESDDIINHLFQNYGPPSQTPLPPRTGLNAGQPGARPKSTVSRILDEASLVGKMQLVMESTADKLRKLAGGANPASQPLYVQSVPWQVRGPFAVASTGMAAVVRLLPAYKMQIDARPDNGEMQPLVLFGYAASPFVRPVREKLCQLGLPHTMMNCCRGSARRAELISRTGKQFQVPYLVDPNTGVEMFESIEIRMYLDRVYTTSGYTPLRGGSWATEQGIVQDQ